MTYIIFNNADESCDESASKKRRKRRKNKQIENTSQQPLTKTAENSSLTKNQKRKLKKKRRKEKQKATNPSFVYSNPHEDAIRAQQENQRLTVLQEIYLEIFLLCNSCVSLEAKYKWHVVMKEYTKTKAIFFSLLHVKIMSYVIIRPNAPDTSPTSYYDNVIS